MSIQLDFSADFSKKEVLFFLEDPQRTEYGPRPVFSGYSDEKLDKITGELKGKDALKLASASRWWIQVTENSQVISSFDMVILTEQEVSVTVFSSLLIRSDLVGKDIAKKLRDAFAEYTYPEKGDPYDYVNRVLGPGHLSEASVRQWYRIKKTPGTLKTHDEQLQFLRKVFEQKNGTGTITPGEGQSPVPVGDQDDKQPGFFHKRNIEYRVIKREPLENPSPNATDEIHQQSDVTIDEALKATKNEVSEDCDSAGLDLYNLKIATLSAWIETRWSWALVEINLDCGIHCSFHFLRMETKNSDLNLYVYGRYPKNLGEIILSVVKKCVVDSALASAVIGVVLGNLPAALAAYRALVTQCIVSRLGQDVKCLIPGLELVTETTKDWS